MKLSNSFMVSARGISNTSSNPEMVLETMKRTFTHSLKLLRSRHVFDLFSKLCRLKVGTNAVENNCKRACEGLGRNRQRSMVSNVMRWKLADARKCLEKSKWENTHEWRKAKRVLTAHRVRMEYLELWRYEVGVYRTHLSEILRKKVNVLGNRYSIQQTVPQSVRGITVGDQQIPDSFSTAPRCYGDVSLNQKELAALSLPPKFAVYSKIDEARCEAEVEKGLAKLRWSLRKREQRAGDECEEQISFRTGANKFDFRHMRATELPFNTRITLPKSAEEGIEIKMQELKRELKKVTTDIKSGVIGDSNMTLEQRQGVKSLVSRVKDKEIVVFQTDKSGRFSVDSPDNYRDSILPHIGMDPEVDETEMHEIENVLNAHGISWTRILTAGGYTGHEKRIRENMVGRNVSAPPLYGLRKDHKVHGDEVVGPPSRPVCGASSSSNYRLSHIISLILSEVWQRDRSGSVCMNTEEMMSDIAVVNSNGLSEKTIIGSTDVKALYPSLDIPFTVDMVGKVFYESAVNIAGVDYEELGLYISLNRTEGEIEALGLGSVCPKRRNKGRGRPPKITGSGIKAEKVERFQPWVAPVSAPNEREQRVMLTEALKIGMLVVMNNHLYTFNGHTYRQESGGSIGLELTGNIAQVFMIWWDREFKFRLTEAGIVTRLIRRYVDDINLAVDELPLGTRYENGSLVVRENAYSEDLSIPADKRTMAIVSQIGNDIHPSIQLEIDCPSNHEDGKVPILDLKVWIEYIGGVHRIVHEFYSKDVSSKAVVNSKSAFSWKQKRTVLTQEMLRVLLNCSSDVPWERVVVHANIMVLRMQYSGYSKKFRYEVVNAALKGYDEIHRKAECGERPLYRPYSWNREERDKAKTEKANTWYGRGGYESVIFVPSTPDSVLQQRYQSEIDRRRLKIRVVEKAGRSIKSMLQRSDPFRAEKCGRQLCLVCGTDGKGSCDKEGITYAITCVDCAEKGVERIYHGETSKNAFTRGKGHLDDFRRKSSDSVMWRHCRMGHNGEVQNFTMSTTGLYRNDAMLRQIAESVAQRNAAAGTLINSKSEWNFVQLPRIVLDTGDRNSLRDDGIREVTGNDVSS